MIFGTAVFMLVALLVMIGERTALQYPGSLAGSLILLIEAAATLSIAVALILAYLGKSPPR